MTPERFQQIEELYHAVRTSAGEERAALLAQADPELRRDVESLLAQPDSARFLDRPAVENANATELGDSTMTVLTAGACLGPTASKASSAKAAWAKSFGPWIRD